MNINLDRYHEAIGIGRIKNPKTFLDKWSTYSFHFVYNKLRKDSDWDEWKKQHKIIIALMKIPNAIHSWLCCGFYTVKDERVAGGKTWNDDYHMMSKLCRYQSWDTVKITWWDKIRFRLITGYKFEN